MSHLWHTLEDAWQNHLLIFYSLSLVCCLQVNSDKIYWQRNENGTFSQLYSEKKNVGHCISTKAVGSDERNDITLLYKYPEGIIKPSEHSHINHSNIQNTKWLYPEPVTAPNIPALRHRGGTHCCGNSVSLRLQSRCLLVSQSRGSLSGSQHGWQRSNNGKRRRTEH